MYILLTEPWGVPGVILLATIGGALGGLAAELVLREGAGQFERPRWKKTELKRFSDFGGWASVIVGAIAALAIFYFVDPQQVTVGEVTADGFDVLKTLSLAIVIGTAGSAIIATLQERAKTVIALKEKDDAIAAGKKGIAAARNAPEGQDPTGEVEDALAELVALEE